MRLALLALSVTLLGIAVAYLWPAKRGIGLVALGALFALIAIWFGEELQMFSTVVISPQTISFDSKFPGETHTFTITNRRGEDVYAVGFLLRIHSPRLTTNDFVLEMPKSSQKPLRDDGNSSDFDDIFGMTCNDLQKRPVFTMSVYRLRGHETREITVTRKASQPVVRIGAEVVAYDNDAALYKESNRTFAPINIGENLVCHSMLMKTPR